MDQSEVDSLRKMLQTKTEECEELKKQLSIVRSILEQWQKDTLGG